METPGGSVTDRSLPPWPKYENDPSFRRWIDSGEHAPDYTFAWFLRELDRSYPAASAA